MLFEYLIESISYHFATSTAKLRGPATIEPGLRRAAGAHGG
jgi:hypothetical protein